MLPELASIHLCILELVQQAVWPCESNHAWECMQQPMSQYPRGACFSNCSYLLLCKPASLLTTSTGLKFQPLSEDALADTPSLRECCLSESGSIAFVAQTAGLKRPAGLTGDVELKPILILLLPWQLYAACIFLGLGE